jgi:protein TonB
MGHTGVVYLSILIGENGRAKAVRLLKTSGYLRLDEAAIKAVRGWIFDAARRGGLNIESWATLKVRFDLH